MEHICLSCLKTFLTIRGITVSCFDKLRGGSALPFDIRLIGYLTVLICFIYLKLCTGKLFRTAYFSLGDINPYTVITHLAYKRCGK